MLFLENTEEKILWKHAVVRHGVTMVDGFILAYRARRAVEAPHENLEKILWETYKTYHGSWHGFLLKAVKTINAQAKGGIGYSKAFVTEFVDREGLQQEFSRRMDLENAG